MVFKRLIKLNDPVGFLIFYGYCNIFSTGSKTGKWVNSIDISVKLQLNIIHFKLCEVCMFFIFLIFVIEFALPFSVLVWKEL